MNISHHNPYVQDILSQADSVKVALARFDPANPKSLTQSIQQTGALILGEASKVAAIGMQAGEFRHGPLELASDKLTVLLFAGLQETWELNANLHKDLKEAGAYPIWVTRPDEIQVQPQLRTPRAVGIGLPLAEIIPIQMLTIHLAQENGIEPGRFFRSGKVTLTE